MIAWALRWVLLCCGLVLLGVGLLDRGTALLPHSASPSRPEAPTAMSVPHPSVSPSNTIVYTANDMGQVVLDATVNGAPIRMLVDTGATLVALTPADARAAGINPASLAFNGRVQTANGSARVARVTLREIRIGQLSIYDVGANVLENLDISLLGMSFLGRLQAYEMRDGKLSISW